MCIRVTDFTLIWSLILSLSCFVQNPGLFYNVNRNCNKKVISECSKIVVKNKKNANICIFLSIGYVLYILLDTVRCRYNGVNFLRNSRERHAKARLLNDVSFVDSISYLYSGLATAVMYAISCYIGQRHNHPNCISKTSVIDMITINVNCIYMYWSFLDTFVRSKVTGPAYYFIIKMLNITYGDTYRLYKTVAFCATGCGAGGYTLPFVVSAGHFTSAVRTGIFSTGYYPPSVPL